MACDGLFKLSSLPLKKLAEIAVALYFWERSDIVKRMKDYFEQEEKQWGHCSRRSCLSLSITDETFILLGKGEFIDYINEQVDLLPIPVKLALGIKIAVSQIWQKACYWRMHIIKNLSLSRKDAEKIHWTSHGEIDQVKTLCYLWSKNIKFPHIYNSINRTNRLCLLNFCEFMRSPLLCAGLLFAKNFENENSVKYRDLFLESPPSLSKEALATGKIIAKWILQNNSCRDGRLLKNSVTRETEQLQEIEKVFHLFHNCISLQFEFGVTYFLDKLSSEKKTVLITRDAEDCVRELSRALRCDENQWLLRGDSLGSIDIESYLKILLILINQMTEIQKMDFIAKNFVVIFQALCVIWLYQDLCAQILYSFWDHISINEEEFLKLIIINYVDRKRREKREKSARGEYVFYPKDHSRYESLDLHFHNPMLSYAAEKLFNDLLCMVMDLASKKPKENVFIKNDFENVRELYEIKDYVSLNIVINDIHLVEYREEVLEIGVLRFNQMISRGNGYDLNKFFEAMKLSQDNLQKFINKLSGFDEILRYAKAAGQNLNWLSKKYESVSQTDAVKIILNLIQNDKLEEADELLFSKFENEKERKNIKKFQISESFILNKIYTIWGTLFIHGSASVFEKQLSCERLLKFFFESQVEINHFKARSLKSENEKLVLEYWNCISYDKSLDNFTKFLEFCSFSNNEIEAMKIKLANDMNLWIDTYALDKNNFEMIRMLLFWVYKGKYKEMEKVLESYIALPKGSLLIMKIFENVSRESLDRIETFFNCWITESTNFYSINLHLDRFEKTKKGIKFSVIKELLEERKQGKFISSKSLLKYFADELS